MRRYPLLCLMPLAVALLLICAACDKPPPVGRPRGYTSEEVAAIRKECTERLAAERRGGEKSRRRWQLVAMGAGAAVVSALFIGAGIGSGACRHARQNRP